MKDLGTTHKCVKNNLNEFRPTWLKRDQTLEDAIVESISLRITMPAAPPPDIFPEPPVSMDDSNEELDMLLAELAASSNNRGCPQNVRVDTPKKIAQKAKHDTEQVKKHIIIKIN